MDALLPPAPTSGLPKGRRFYGAGFFDPDAAGYSLLSIEVSPQARSIIEQLFATGLYGLTIERVVEEMVLDRVREAIRRSVAAEINAAEAKRRRRR